MCNMGLINVSLDNCSEGVIRFIGKKLLMEMGQYEWCKYAFVYKQMVFLLFRINGTRKYQLH